MANSVDGIEIEENCDIFRGKLVMDYKRHPLYNQQECEYLQKWKWNPTDCSLPK